MDTAATRDDLLAHALDAWGDAVYRLALASLRSPADAQDVAQDVFLALMEHPRAFQDDEHLKAWLLRVTINRCRDLARTAWRRRVDALDATESGAPADALTDTAPTPEDAAVQALTRHPVWRALEQLPEEQRVSMHLRYVDECTEADIARITGVRPATVRTRLHRARRKLRALLERDGGDVTAPASTDGAPPRPAEDPAARRAPPAAQPDRTSADVLSTTR